MKIDGLHRAECRHCSFNGAGLSERGLRTSVQAHVDLTGHLVEFSTELEVEGVGGRVNDQPTIDQF